MNEIYEFIKKCETYYLTTIDSQGKPRIRPFGTIDIFDGQLTIQTGKVKEVSKQIHNNPNVAICAFNGEEWVRLNATAIEETNIEAAKHMLQEYPSLQKMYQAGDGNTEIFKLVDVTASINSFVNPPKNYKW